MKQLLIILIFFNQFAFSQNVDEIIQKHMDAMGLTQNKIQTCQFDAEYRLQDSTKTAYQCKVYFKSPNFWRIEKFDASGKVSSYEVVRGDSAWEVKKSAIDSHTDAVFTVDLPMFAWPDHLSYSNVIACDKRYIGPASNGTDEQFWMSVFKKSRYCIRMYSVKTTTNYISNILEYVDKVPRYTVTLNDYQTLNGIIYPAKIQQTDYETGVFYSSLEKKNVEVNISLSDKLFEKPR